MCVSQALYRASVTMYGHPSGLESLPGLDVSSCLSALGGSIVQSIFAYRIYILSRHRLIIPVICWALALVRLGGGAATTGIAFRAIGRSVAGNIHQYSWISTLALSASAAADVIIAIALTCLFWTWKAGISS
jgi:hypothetical protein